MLEVNNITKKYNVSKSPWKRILYNFGAKSISPESDFFYALRDVSFKIERGETVGIIGKNGAGKSTLLQIICGTLKATNGNVKRPKKVAALLELGAGFNPEYTGIENIFLNGALIGMSKKEIENKLDSIITFSELGDFVFNPVKTFSSGMFARLAFSIAVHSSPELLIVDEALSVGDMAFQEKSINKMKELRDSGIPIFFVSHSLPMVRNFCTRAIWMEKGQVKMDGEAKTICSAYLDDNDNVNSESVSETIRMTPDNPKLTIESFHLCNKEYTTGGDMEISFELIQKEPISGKLGIGLIIRDDNEKIVSIISTVRDAYDIDSVPETIKCFFSNISLLEGTYTVSVSVTDELSTFHYDRIDYICWFSVVTRKNSFGLPQFEGTHGLQHKWEMI